MTDRPPDRKRPRATFGDVMKGVPAGRPQEERKPPEAPEAKAEEPKKVAKPPARRRRETKPAPKAPEVRPEVVVVRRGPHLPEAKATPAAVPPPRPAMPPLIYSQPVVPSAGDESFAELLAQSELGPRRRELRPGTRVAGSIIQLGHEMAFLVLDGGEEAMIELRELSDEGAPPPQVGDRVEGYVTDAGGRDGGLRVAKSLGKGAANLERLAQARAAGMPVEGTVAAVNKGGLEVDLGGARGFCPISQADLHFVEDAAQFVGQRLSFQVTAVKGTDVVLSRRALLEAERARAAARTRESLAVGARFKGRVTSLRDFGAFVDLGGMEGLIHVSELSHGRVTHPRDVLQVGQEVEVEVVKIEAADPASPDKSKHRERIGLSLRALEADPWERIEERFPVGSRHRGTIMKLQPFGAFVSLAPGIDGLIHVSALSERRIHHPKEVVGEGEIVEVAIEKIDPAQRRIALVWVRDGELVARPVAPEGAEGAAAGGRRVVQLGDVVEAVVDKVEPFGIFVRFGGGRGLVPNVEMGTPKGTDHRKQFPSGTALKLAVIDVDPAGRIRLSKVAAEQAEERAEVSRYLGSQPASKGSGFGTLGDLLRAKKP